MGVFARPFFRSFTLWWKWRTSVSSLVHQVVNGEGAICGGNSKIDKLQNLILVYRLVFHFQSHKIELFICIISIESTWNEMEWYELTITELYVLKEIEPWDH